MAKSIYYAIKRDDLWLQRIEPNEYYCPSSKAPTMGTRHDTSEFKAVWGDTPVKFERLTAINNSKVILEEQRWESDTIFSFEIVPFEGR